MNFSPKEVKASKKACIEYSRLLNLLDGVEDKGLAFNKGVESEGLERPWYTTYAQRFAAKVTTSDIKNEKRKRKAAAPTGRSAGKKSKVNNAANAKKSSDANPTTDAKKPDDAKKGIMSNLSMRRKIKNVKRHIQQRDHKETMLL